MLPSQPGPFQLLWDEFLAEKQMSLEERQLWEKKPLDKKISRILQEVALHRGHLNETDLNRLEVCWIASKDCNTGFKIIEVRLACQEVIRSLFQDFSKVQTKTIYFHCSDGPVAMPEIFKEALAKDSPYFLRLFGSGMMESSTNEYSFADVTNADFADLIRIWLGQIKLDANKAYELLGVSHRFSLALPSFIAVLLSDMNTWNVQERDDVQMAARMLGEIKFLDIEELQNKLSQFLAKAYLKANRQDRKEDAQECLSLIQQANITNLNLDDEHVSDTELKKLIENCPHLRSLSLGSAKITDESAKHIASLSSLKILDLGYCQQLTDWAAEELSVLTGLTSLDVRNCFRLTDAAVREFAKLKSLKNLNLASCPGMTNQAAKELAKLTSLTHLNVYNAHKLTDEAAKEFAKLTNLTSLDLSNCRELTGRAVAELAKLPRLESLTMSFHRFQDETAEEFAKLTSLISLDLSGCRKLTNKVARELSKLKNLRTLILDHTKIKDEVAKELAELTNLTRLAVNDCQLTYQAVKEFSELKNLRILEMNSNPMITDAGALECTKLPHLEQLIMSRCKLTKNTVDHLKEHISEVYGFA